MNYQSAFSIPLLTVVALFGAVRPAHAQIIALPVLNGDFEADADGTEGATGWDIQTGGTDTHFWTSAGAPQLTGTLDPATGEGGSGKFLTPNRLASDPDTDSNPASSFASQRLDFTAWAAGIDAASVSLNIGFFYSNGKNTDELSTVTVEFLDASDASLGVISTGDLPQTAEGGWSAGTIGNGALAVPAGARSFVITLNQRRLGGTATNGGFDTVTASLLLGTPLTVVNGDFETDADGTEGASGWNIPTGGTTTHFWTSAGAPELTGALDPATGQGGSGKFLSPNRTASNPDTPSNPASSFASQEIDLSAWAAGIDAASVSLNVGFHYSNGKNTDERSVVSVEFLDGSASSLGVASTGDLPQTAEGAWSAGSMGSELLVVPAGTRSFIITLNQRRLGGTGTNAGFDTITASLFTTGSPRFQLSGFTYNPTDGSAEVSIIGSPGARYRLVEADDLDFTNPDQNPIPLTGATVGTLDGDEVITDENGNATVNFNLGTAKDATFLRAETAP